MPYLFQYSDNKTYRDCVLFYVTKWRGIVIGHYLRNYSYERLKGSVHTEYRCLFDP